MYLTNIKGDIMEHLVEQSKEDYLEAILMIREDQGYVRSTDIAKKLNVTKPSVTYITKKLKEQNLIEMDKNNMIVLTETGEKIATEIFTRHKILTDFFVSIGVSKNQAQLDACQVEHAISKETFNCIKKRMK